MLQGAAVHVSMIAFRSVQEVRWPSRKFGADGLIEPSHGPYQLPWPDEDQPYTLNGEPVDFINADLTSGSNTASALRLKENEGICFMGTTKVGAFEIDIETASRMALAPTNPNGRPNADVVRPWVNATNVMGRTRPMFIIDFGTDMTEHEAALYELPFEYVRHHVKPVRQANNRELYATKWWIHGEPRTELRRAIKPLGRYILTPRVSRHRVFVWLPVITLPDSATFAFAREDDYFFGVLHCSIHELWARAQGTQLREVESGFRYTPNSTFDTFPFPYPPGTEPSEADSPIVRAIADAARELVRLRDAWLKPPNPFHDDLTDRTLTKLYNARPAWLDNAHRALDAAVFAAYGWPADLSDQEILARLLALNHERAAAQSTAVAAPSA
jgi:type II restriction/modification system DNA methylase subunit YeeA